MEMGTTGENCNAQTIKENQVEGRQNKKQDQTTTLANNNEQTEPFSSEIITPTLAEKVLPSTTARIGSEMRGARKMSADVPDKARHIKLSANVQHLVVLGRLAEVDKKMANFREYIQTQKDGGKPLYQWDKYTDYRAISRAVSELDEAIAKFKQHRLPQEHVTASLARATSYSTSVSMAAAYVLRVMSEKTEKYTKEMDESTLSDKAKANAHALITEEVQKLLEHSTQATGRVWAALDLLQGLDKSSTTNVAPRKSWFQSVGTAMLTAGVSAAVGIAAASLHLHGSAGFDLAFKSAHEDSVYNQVLDLVQRTQAITNLTSDIYMVRLEDLDQRYEDLSALAKSCGLRIDNLVEALGPSNEEGLYYSSMPKVDDTPRGDIDSRLQRVSDDANRQMQRLHDEMELMRKNMNRLDVRLTRRLDKIRGKQCLLE